MFNSANLTLLSDVDQSKEEGKDQESIKLSTTHEPEHHKGK